MNDPKEPRDPLLLEHEVDGIQELDNNLPRWWVWLFILCTVHAFAYMLYYHVFGMGPLQAAEYAIEAKAGEEAKVAAQKKFEASITSLQPSKDDEALARGRRTFEQSCAPCHRMDGGGLVGPNLCDDFWIHGARFEDNLKTIVNGVPVKGMLAWKDSLKPSEIYEVASYIYTLRGTQPPNPKLPENQQQPEKPNEFE
jgi:cytochrome c oxidase cbb3-type subunit 3